MFIASVDQKNKFQVGSKTLSIDAAYFAFRLVYFINLDEKSICPPDPTMFAPPFVLNYLLPERLAESVLHLMQPGRERSGKQSKRISHLKFLT